MIYPINSRNTARRKPTRKVIAYTLNKSILSQFVKNS
nr:MAG TPA: hypothetical protein [Bacteriophage sp.]